MAVTVRLFAALRDAAGTSTIEVEPDTVPMIVAGLRERFGEPFARHVAIASGMLDGRRVALDEPIEVAAGSELALLPPFSGGSTATADQQRVHRLLLVGSLLVPGLLIVGLSSTRWSFGLVVVVIAAGSLVDLHAALGATAVRTMLPASVVLGVGPAILLVLAPSAAGRWLGGLVAVAVMLSFSLAFASPRRHDTAAIVGATLLAGALVAVGTAALVALYDRVDPASLVGLLVLVALTDCAVIVASRPTVPDRPGRRLLAALAVCLPTALVLYVIGDRVATTARLVAGAAVVAVTAALASARLRQALRPTGTGQAVPALLIGTADAVLLGAPIAFLWVVAIGA